MKAPIRLSSTEYSLQELREKIATKGDEIRKLKADGISKAELSPHVDELLALKSNLPPADEPKVEVKSSKPKAKPRAKPVRASETDFRQIRLGKIEDMRKAGVEPFEYTFAATTTADDLARRYQDKLAPGEEDELADVAVAGRIMMRRVFGKLAFLSVQDESGAIQVQLDKGRLGDSFKDLKAWTDSGDIIGVSGSVRRTDKGELTLYAKEWKMLTKAILPLPDKFHGLKDITLRYRNRHVDLIVNPDVRDTFRTRAKITSTLRRLLDDQGFLEIETPVLHSQSGGAEAKPFQTHHNSMHLDLTLRIATELHLKRLIIGGYHSVYEIGRIFRE